MLVVSWEIRLPCEWRSSPLGFETKMPRAAAQVYEYQLRSPRSCVQASGFKDESMGIGIVSPRVLKASVGIELCDGPDSIDYTLRWARRTMSDCAIAAKKEPALSGLNRS